MSANKNHDAQLNDDAFGNDEPKDSRDNSTQQQSAEARTEHESEEVGDEYDYEDEPEEELDEPAPLTSAKKRIDKRERVVIAVVLGLLATLGIVGVMWKLALSANGFKAPVPSEPIDMAEKQNNRKNEPTDYADEEQMRTMNYDSVNSIYGLALKKQQANHNRQLTAKDSAHRDPAVRRELARSGELARQQNYRRSSSTGGSKSPRRAPSQTYNSAYNGRATEYGDPYHANPTREDLLLRAGFNTVKAEGNGITGYGGQQTLPPPSLASVEVDDYEPIPGVVSGDQTIMNGTRVMFRTLADAKIRDRFAPKGSILVGFAQVGSSRAIFNITTLRLSTGEAVPVRLRALDPDMNEGLALQSDKPARQQVGQATDNALNQAAGQAAWSAGSSINQATRVPVAGNALASLGAGLASAATNGRRREVRQKLNLQDGFKVFFVRDGGPALK